MFTSPSPLPPNTQCPNSQGDCYESASLGFKAHEAVLKLLPGVVFFLKLLPGLFSFYNFSLGCFLFTTSPWVVFFLQLRPGLFSFCNIGKECALTTESTCPCPLNAKVKVTFCQFKNSNADFLFKKSRFVIVNNRRKIGSITHTGTPVKD